jgi:hypothetical protein
MAPPFSIGQQHTASILDHKCRLIDISSVGRGTLAPWQMLGMSLDPTSVKKWCTSRVEPSIRYVEHNMIAREFENVATFWLFLLSIDQDLAERLRQKGCSCGGRLHRADYPRAPRGGPPDLPEQCCYRFSFCCDRDGCRKRATPPSVRFLGRKVYLGAVVVLISAMRQGPTPRRVGELSRLFGVDAGTITRWQAFWRDHVAKTPFWRIARARLLAVVESTAALPRSLVEAFCCTDDVYLDWVRLLRFLSPISVAGSSPSELF